MKLHFYIAVIAFALICVVRCAPKDRKNKKLRESKNKDLQENINKVLKDSSNNELKNNKTRVSEEDKQFEKQIKALDKLGCKPNKCKVATKSLLSPTNVLHDYEHVYPEFVVIKKCKESCSYCHLEQDDLGIESRVCVAVAKKIKTKKVLVKFFDLKASEWKYEYVETEEHKKCECKAKDELEREKKNQKVKR